MAYVTNCEVCYGKVASDAGTCPHWGTGGPRSKQYERENREREAKAIEERKKREEEIRNCNHNFKKEENEFAVGSMGWAHFKPSMICCKCGFRKKME